MSGALKDDQGEDTWEDEDWTTGNKLAWSITKMDGGLVSVPVNIISNPMQKFVLSGES